MLIKDLFKQFRWQFVFTASLLIVEALLGILFPYFIGKAIGGVLEKELSGIWQLGILGLLMILLGGGRRFFDSRFYAGIYSEFSRKVLGKMQDADHSLKSARLQMMAEMVKFAEIQLPNIIHHSIGLLGVMIMIATLNWKVFVGSLVVTAIIAGLYWLTGEKTFRYNFEYNNELESQVNILMEKRPSQLKLHLMKLMKWNIKLSDIETMNYSISWLIMIALLLVAILFSTDGTIQYGVLFALIMYVYQFIESMVNLPLYYQEWLRLKEITQRIQTF